VPGLAKKGFCAPNYPVEWTCEGTKYEDGKTCDCACGTPDPDCLGLLPVVGCKAGEACAGTACVPAVVNDTCANALPLPIGVDVAGTLAGAKQTYGTDGAACIGFTVQSGPDAVYSVALTAGQTLSVVAEAPTFEEAAYLLGPGDPSICNDALTACVAGGTWADTPTVDKAAFTFTATTTGTYYLVIDTMSFVETGGAFSLKATLK
jgi:hypothetical protein